MIDTRTPSGLARMLAAETAEAHTKAFARYPHDREKRLADTVASLGALLEVAVDQLRSMETP